MSKRWQRMEYHQALSCPLPNAAGGSAGARVALQCSPDRRTVAQNDEDDSRRCCCSAAQHIIERHVNICTAIATRCVQDQCSKQQAFSLDFDRPPHMRNVSANLQIYVETLFVAGCGNARGL